MGIDWNPFRAVRRGWDALAALPRRVAVLAGRLLPDRLALSGSLPAYTPLAPAARAGALQRSTGLTVPQPISSKPGDPAGEPVTMVMTGSFEEVTAALTRAGWVRADTGRVDRSLRAYAVMGWGLLGLDRVVDLQYRDAPMSTLYLHGRPQVAGFEKNNDHHVVRDHLRVFESGRRDEHGRPIWEITASRDVGIYFDSRGSHHSIDTHLDPERDMLMADLLASGQVRDWRIVRGEMTDRDRALAGSRYRFDGNVYVVDLGRSPPEASQVKGS